MNASTVGRVTWWDYVTGAAGGDDQATIARKSGVGQSMVSRWRASVPHPENAAAFARAYGRPVLEAFIAAGFLTPEEADEKPSAPPSLASLSDEELLDAVRARMKGERDGRQPEPEKSGRVIELPARGDGQQTWAANETGEPPETDAE
jgi:transcriptional regulator with XRE-family HTH domain